MLVLPTSATTAIILEQPQGSPLWVLFGYVTVVLFAGGLYCAWEMLLASVTGRTPSSSRWVMLLVSAMLFGSGILVDALANVPAVFSDQLETTWGFVLSPWLFIAFIPFAAVLVVLRAFDARQIGSFARIPGILWWCAGLVSVSAYATGALWSWGRPASIGSYVTAGGEGLAIVGLGLLAVAVLRRAGRGAAA